ncbi:hypothetical protein EDB86DRAFT_3070969 [Lactarius hatsudake]|nr:hypothetical protein EDB86DRAFT_3070969 [Lactarius hatsudake]
MYLFSAYGHLQVPRLRITRHSQLSLFPLDDDLSRTPTAALSLPSIYAAVEDTPAARLRALLAQVPNTSSASRTQLLHEPPPPLPSDRDSDFDPPPKWANSSTTSSARENLRSVFTHALRDPGDTPRKEHAANMEALRSRILGACASQSDASMSVASDSSTDNDALIREMHDRTVTAPGISSASDSFGSTSTNQAPSFPQMAEPSLPARSLSSLVRAGSLTETKPTTNVLRQSEGTQTQRDRYDSVERPSKLANGVVIPPVAASNAGSVVGTGEFYPETLVYALSYITCSAKRSEHPSSGAS